MRLLHLFASPYWSGPAENIALLARTQRELGHEVSVAIDRKRSVAPAEELALPHFAEMELLDQNGLELSVKSSPRQIWGDFHALRRCSADVIHTHFTHDHYLARWSRSGNQIVVRSLHSPRSIRWTLPSADGFTVPSEHERKLLGNSPPTMILPALVGPEYTEIQDKEGLRRELGLSGEPIIGMASTFKRSRRHQLGLEAFHRIRESRPLARMLLMGDGEELSNIRVQADRLALTKHLEFTGYVSGSEYVRRLQSLDVLWVLGLGNDWSARVAAQANACGVAVVSVAEGALRELADAIVPQITAEAVARATLDVKRQPRSRPTNLQIASEMIDFYSRLMERTSRRESRNRGYLRGLS
jgi:glycosyltransferase involved in cell wall biosynthesis